MIQSVASIQHDNHKPIGILVASHGLFLKRMAMYFYRNCDKLEDFPPLEEMVTMSIPNTGISKLTLEVDSETLALASVKAHCLFSAAHLEE